MSKQRVSLVAFLALGAGFAVHANSDILIADFEGKDYGAWKVEGTAFGPGPARGTLPHQMAVAGYAGQGLVNSFCGGDRATGRLTSPEFKIERKFIHFLIGGGGWAGQTCMNLLLGEKIVRTAAGPNLKPGGSEDLAPAAWDVTEFLGRTARLEIVDAAQGGWGHINVDQITQSDQPAPVVPQPVQRERTLTLDKKYLLFPVQNGAKKDKKERLAVRVDGVTVREMDIALSATPAWFAQLDVSAWQGRQAVLHVDKMPEDSKALDLVATSATLWHADEIYREPLRGQLHFSPRRGWNNDPNGMVFADGEYHLYFQHNPYGWSWGNMHWGLAVSPDMVHWREEPIAIYPHEYGDWAFSGSAVVDQNNTSGWRTGTNALIVAAYTSTGRGECIVYSNDRGRTFTEFAGNPVVKHKGRDPRLLWYAASRQWVMAVYDEFENTRCIAFHTSPDLRTWTFQSRIADFFECPDLFELPMHGTATLLSPQEGDRSVAPPAKKYWVLTAASSDYMVGTFDGQKFTPATPKLKGHLGKGFYAAQTFSDEPKGRVVQIGWLQTATRGMPFNQSMSLPHELKLVTTADGPRLTWTPVKELATLRAQAHHLGPLTLKPGDPNPLAQVHGELLEVRAEFAAGDAAALTFTLRGAKISYDFAKQELTVNEHRAPAPLRGGKQRLIIYVDRTALEIFASDGLTYVPLPFFPQADDRALDLSAAGGAVRLDSLHVFELNSCWPRK